jgi:hypothetical protein
MGRPKGSKNRFYRKQLVGKGYIAVWKPEHREAMRNGYVLEHRMIISDLLGRKLLTTEEVHHKNEIKTDNRPENLIVLTKPQHTSITWKGRKRRAWTKSERIAKSKQMRGNQNWRGNIYENPDLLQTNP